MSDWNIQLLEPPYREFIPFDTSRHPPTGTIALTPPLADMLQVERAVRYVAMRAPWVPVAVWTTVEGRFQLDVTLQSVRLLTGSHPALVVPATGTHPLVQEVLTGIARRTPPRADQLAEWCAARMARPDLVEDLTLAMQHHAQALTPAEDRSLRRRLAKEGLPPRLMLHRLPVLAGAFRLDQPFGELEAHLGFKPSQLRQWLDRMAGTTAERWIRQPGWEWLVEEMLRLHAAQASRQPLLRPWHGIMVPGQPAQYG